MSSTDLYFVNLPVRQINGCRYFGPRDEVKLFNPPKGSEIFVARIPQDFPHKELLRIFVNAGQVYDVRLMLTFMKENKGYAFVRYFSPEMAAKAINQINGYRLATPGRRGHLVAMLSTDHRTLMLTGCTPDVTREEVECVFRNISGTELASVSEEFLKGQTSPVFYLLFESHRGAALTKKMNWKDLIPKDWGVWVELSWQPNNEVNQRRRFKLERKNYLSFLASGASVNFNGFQNRPVNPGFPRGILSSLNTEVQPPTQPLEKTLVSKAGPSGLNVFAPVSSFPRGVLSSLNTEVQPPTQPLEKTLVSKAGPSGLNVFAPVFKINEQMSQKSILPSPGHFLLPKKGLNTAQGIANYSPLSQLSENVQRQWGLETSSQSQGSSCFEPEGAWGGAPLVTPPQRDLTGNTHSQWCCVDPPSGRRNFSFEPEDTLGISSLLIQDREPVTDENSQPQLPWPLSSSLFGRPIRGRGNDDQTPKSMRF